MFFFNEYIFWGGYFGIVGTIFGIFKDNFVLQTF